jgi:hypothetical protein
MRACVSGSGTGVVIMGDILNDFPDASIVVLLFSIYPLKFAVV